MSSYTPRPDGSWIPDPEPTPRPDGADVMPGQDDMPTPVPMGDNKTVITHHVAGDYATVQLNNGCISVRTKMSVSVWTDKQGITEIKIEPRVFDQMPPGPNRG